MCNGNFGSDPWWIIILLLLFGNNGCGCGGDRFEGFGSCGSSAWWIVILALLGAFGSGCDNGGSCGCGSSSCGC